MFEDKMVTDKNIYFLLNCVILLCTCYVYGVYFGGDGPIFLAEEDERCFLVLYKSRLSSFIIACCCFRRQ